MMNSCSFAELCILNHLLCLLKFDMVFLNVKHIIEFCLMFYFLHDLSFIAYFVKLIEVYVPLGKESKDIMMYALLRVR